jgi:hypothetical protein
MASDTSSRKYGESVPETTQISPENIEASPHNPRLVFDAEDLRRLRESIDEVGILVPLTVYQTDGRYRLIDGERRWRCALELGLDTVPAYVVDGVNETRELEWMFSIHMMREEWEDGPVAKALRDLAGRLQGWDTEQLKAITGLTAQRLNYFKALADAPPEILERVIRGELPPNLVADSVLRVARPLRDELPEVAADHSANDVIHAMVTKREVGALPDVVALRDLRTMIRVASQEAGSDEEAREIVGAIVRVLDDPAATIEDAYQDTVQTRVAADSFTRAIERFKRSAEHVVGAAVARADQRAELADELESLSRFISDLAARLRESQ